MTASWDSESIKKMRKELGLNQIEFARALGLTRQQTISSLETGMHLPSKMMGILLTQLEKSRRVRVDAPYEIPGMNIPNL